jgi:hypothetical protein
MDPEVFIFIAFEAFAVLGVVLLGWTLLHLAAPRHDDELPH